MSEKETKIIIVNQHNEPNIGSTKDETVGNGDPLLEELT